MESVINNFEELAKVDCTPYVEKKGKFTYLSWPFAFAELFKRHPKAEIDVREWDGLPVVRGPKGWMVSVSVSIDGVRRTQWHPVLDNNNRPIMEPDVFHINTSIQRASVKAIALHGLGLYIYAGEDLPEGAETAPVEALTDFQAATIRDRLETTGSDVPKFCEMFGADCVDNIAAAKYKSAMSALDAKEKQLAQTAKAA